MKVEFPYESQPNLAPVESVKKAEVRKPEPDKPFLKWVSERYDCLSKEDQDVWRDIYAACHLVCLFYEGKQLLRRSTFGSGWRVYGTIQDTGQGNIRSINLTRFYVDNIVVKWTQSSADLIVRPSRDTDEAQGAARAADVLIEHYENEWYTPTFRQNEARLAVLTGNFFRRIYYSQKKKATARRPQIEKRTIGGGAGSGYCADCGYTGSPDEFSAGAGIGVQGMATANAQLPGAVAVPACPHCGSEAVEIEQVPEVEIDAVVGKQEFEVGDLVCQSVPIFNVQFDVTGPLEDSPWLLYTRRVRRDVLRSMFAGALQFDRGEKGDDYGLDAVDALARTGQATSGRGGTASTVARTDDRKQDTVDLAELWLDPQMYGDVVLPEPVKTVSGQTIPAGPLVDTFPDGMCIVGVNEMKTILFLYNENHRDHWVSGQFHLKPMSGVGDGIVDIIEVQRQFNIGNSQIWTQIRTQATPAVLYDKDLITSDKAAYLGMPQQNIPVDLSRLPDQRKLSDAVYALSPHPVAAHVVEYSHNWLNNMFQLTSHATDFSGGLPGVNNTTATGAQIAAANAQSMHAPQLAVLADVNRRTAQLMLRLYQKYCPDERYFALMGKNGKQDGFWLRGADVMTDLVVEVVAESHLPQTGLERRERLKEFLGFFGGVEGLQAAMNTSPELVVQLKDLFDISLKSDDYSTASVVARRRIEQMKAVLPQVMQTLQQYPPQYLESMAAFGVQPDVMMGTLLLNAIEPKPDVREPDHNAAIAYYQQWLLTDEGLEAAGPLREAVKALIDQHVRFAAQGLQVAAGLAIDPMQMGAMMSSDAGGVAGGPGIPAGASLPAPMPGPEQNVAQSAFPNLKAPMPGAMV